MTIYITKQEDLTDSVLVYDLLSNKSYEVTGDELISALCLFLATKKEMEDLNNE